MSIDHLLNETAQVRRVGYVSTGTGGDKAEWGDSGDPIGVRIRPVGAQETFFVERTDVKVTHIVYTAPGADLVHTDHIVVEGTEQYYIIEALDPSKAHHRKFVAEAIPLDTRVTSDGRVRVTQNDDGTTTERDYAS